MPLWPQVKSTFESIIKSDILGGKRSAIIDKKARQCLNEADQKLNKMRDRFKDLGALLEQHRRFERLHEELDKWTGFVFKLLLLL